MAEHLSERAIAQLADLEAAGVKARLEADGIKWFSWCGVLIFKCPTCDRFENENAQLVLSHARQCVMEQNTVRAHHGLPPIAAKETVFPGMEGAIIDGTSDDSSGRGHK